MELGIMLIWFLYIHNISFHAWLWPFGFIQPSDDTVRLYATPYTARMINNLVGNLWKLVENKSEIQFVKLADFSFSLPLFSASGKCK